MPRPRVRVQPAVIAAVDPLAQIFSHIRSDNQIPSTFSTPALEQARNAKVAEDPTRRDATDVEFVTLDPPGSKDLDQALHIQPSDQGYRVRYAIADVPAFIPAGSALDVETRQRGVTLYCPDVRIGLHPPQLSEDAASLLPGQRRPALVWDFHLDHCAAVRSVELSRCWVQSRAQLDYASVQQALNAGGAAAQALPETMRLLAQVGPLRQVAEQARGGVSLPVPEQEVLRHPSSSQRCGNPYSLQWRPVLPIEQANAQISLMTGMAAANMMLSAGVGIVRTMPTPPDQAMLALRHSAKALGADWPTDVTYGHFLQSLDHTNPQHLAVIYAAVKLFRGAGYAVVDSGASAQDPGYLHSAVAAPYAHVTAPLRRLVDRFSLACCLAIASGSPAPEWVEQGLVNLPELMANADRRANAVDRACTNAVEAAVLCGHQGEHFDAVAVSGRTDAWTIQVSQPPVLARCTGAATLGERLQARLVTADISTHSVEFTAG